MKTIIRKSQRVVHRNSPTILAALGASGVLTTAYLAARAGYQSAPMLQEAEAYSEEPLTLREQFDVVWELYIPTVISGGVSIACIVASTRVHSKRTAALAAAYSVSEQAFHEYKTKVIDQIGEKKEQAIRDEIAAEAVEKSPPSVIVNNGQVLCCELHTMRYFHYDIELLRQARNELNQRLVANTWAYLSDFYDIIDLEHTSSSDQFGWDADKLMELEFSTTLAKDGVPCITFDYNYLKPL